MSDRMSVSVALVAVPFGLAVGFAVGGYVLISTAYVVSHLWAWYAVPLGLPALAWARVAGLMLIANLLRAKYPKHEPKPKDERDTSVKVVELVMFAAMPWLALLVGWWLR